MRKPWDDEPLWKKLYLWEDGVHRAAACIIGYAGCSPFEFFDQAKLLPNYDKGKFERAVRDLTLYATREGPYPRYELHSAARKAVRVLLGPHPDDPEYAHWHELRAISRAEMGQTEVRRPDVPVKKPAKKETRKPPAKKPRKKTG